MKLLFLRGQVPTDRDPKEISYTRLKQIDDLWEQLAVQLTKRDDITKILYWGGKRRVFYCDNVGCEWVPSFKRHVHALVPDVIFARGGFKEYDRILKRFPNAVTIYYGAGVRTVPERFYDVILVDTDADRAEAIKRHPNSRVILWVKPAVDFLFTPSENPIIHDVCFVANGGQAKIKNIKWVYKTVPHDIRLYHLGIPSRYKAPQNVFRNRVLRSRMPKELGKCKIGIVPYSSYDSAPRVIPEMLACGLPIVALNTTRAHYFGYCCEAHITVAPKLAFWDVVRQSLDRWTPSTRMDLAEQYRKKSGLASCAVRLRGIIEEELMKKERLFHVRRTIK